MRDDRGVTLDTENTVRIVCPACKLFNTFPYDTTVSQCFNCDEQIEVNEPLPETRLDFEPDTKTSRSFPLPLFQQTPFEDGRCVHAMFPHFCSYCK